MKKILLSLLALLLLLNVGGVCSAEATAPGLRLDANGQAENGYAEDDYIVVCVEQPVYLPVTLILQGIDGTVNEFRLAPKVLDITYKFCVYTDASGEKFIGGGRFYDENFPRLTVNDQSGMDLRVSCAAVSQPSSVRFLASGDGYTATIRGGTFSITYDSVIRFNARGLESRESTTVVRAYNYTHIVP